MELEYVTVWDGAHRSVNADLLCVDLDFVPTIYRSTRSETLHPSWPERHSRVSLREQLMHLLRQKPVWEVQALQKAVSRDRTVVNTALYCLKRQGYVEGHGYGRVAWTRQGERNQR